ncbi:MAG TPA: ABC transporter ATP-binding protein [Gammaproteobacteria bacterium]|nr:ABC transporter ATP-binding protein [Gammaproteobacteria bacterium]
MTTGSPILRLRGIHKTYVVGESRVHALRGIDLDIEAGEFTALEGPSGCGKSTLLNICGLLDRADQGELHLLGEKLNGAGERRFTRLRREHIGFVFQNYNLLPVLSAAENIEYPLLLSRTPRQARRRQVDAIIEQVGLEAFAGHRPDHLSGGQRQRVAIARALINRPRLVIADEPTANLDTETASQMIELMRGLGRSRGTTFLIATHDDRMARRCDRIITLLDGVAGEKRENGGDHEMA